MPEINEQSTAEGILSSYFRNCDWYETQSVAKAKAFVTACMAYLGLGRKGSLGGRGGAEYELDPPTVRELMRDAQSFVVANDTVGDMNAADFTTFDSRR